MKPENNNEYQDKKNENRDVPKFNMSKGSSTANANSSENFTEEYHPNFITFPLANTETIEEDSQATLPAEWAVKEAKDWVDSNEK